MKKAREDQEKEPEDEDKRKGEDQSIAQERKEQGTYSRGHKNLSEFTLLY